MTQVQFKEKVASRKFVLMLMIFFFGTLCLALPALTVLCASVKLAAMMTGGEYVSLIIGCFAIYSGANVAQKKFETPKENINE